MPGTNTLAYLASSSAKNKTSFITLTPGGVHIKRFLSLSQTKRHHDTQHNGTQHNDIYHDIQHNDKLNCATHNNDTQHNSRFILC